MSCIKEIFLLLCHVLACSAIVSHTIHCHVCTDATCDTLCNEGTDNCAGSTACLIEVTSDPSYKTEYISKSCNSTCNPHSLNKFQCHDDYCYERVYCCTTDLCNAVTPKRPIPASPDAPVGPKGFVGRPGPAGLPGAPGSKGVIGPEGPVGPFGNIGPVGSSGDKGIPGVLGFIGRPGANGPVGPVGLRGLPGPQGPPGYYGHDGPDGEKGSRGDLGPQGPVGFPGLRGATGPRGLKGCKGMSESGAPGDKGEVGWPGLPGSAFPGGSGDKGPKGPDGVRGGSGDDGEDGSCTCDIEVEHICFSVWQDFVFLLPPDMGPFALLIEGFVFYQNTFGPGTGLDEAFIEMIFFPPVNGLYIFSITSVASCNFATAVGLYRGTSVSGPFELVISTDRSVPNFEEEMIIGVTQVVLCLKPGDVLLVSALSPKVPHPEDPEDPWENNSPSFVTFTGCLHTRGLCGDVPMDVDVSK